jgi:hypothetical protein
LVTDQQIIDGVGPIEDGVIAHDPAPSLDPGPRTLVNLATILTAGAGETTVTKDATDNGEAVTFTASPSFHWDFGDGSTLATDEPGIPYSGEGDPSAEPDSYLLHTWRQTGTRTVTLTTTWTGTVLRHSTGVTLTLVPQVFTATTTVHVLQSRATLTGNS